MNKQNILLSCSLFLLMALVMSSCYKEPDFIGDNSTTDGKHYPVISGFELLTPIELSYQDTVITGMDTVVTEVFYYDAATELNFDLDFWSTDDISTIQFFARNDAGEVELQSSAYVANFQEDSQTDELLFSYVFPATPSPDTFTVFIDAVITNKNGLTVNSKDGGTGNRPSLEILVIR